MRVFAALEDRNSGLELLKVFSLIGILIMHLFGIVFHDEDISTLNLGITVIVNAAFNAGVSCLALISGYFGLKLEFKRTAKLWMSIIFFSAAAGCIKFAVMRGGTDLLKAFFPIFTKKSWYFSCYMVLVFLSGPLNYLVKNFSRKQLRAFIAVMMLWFVLVPTVFYFEIMEDRGKGLMNIMLLYLIGRYINLYIDTDERKIGRKQWGLVAISCFLIITILNGAITAVCGEYKSPFARDNSLFILLEAVAIFMVFKGMKFKSRAVNFLGKSTMPAFLMDSAIRAVLLLFVDLHIYSDKAALFPVVLAISIVIYAVATVAYFVYEISLYRVIVLVVDRADKALRNNVRIMKMLREIQD